MALLQPKNAEKDYAQAIQYLQVGHSYPCQSCHEHCRQLLDLTCLRLVAIIVVVVQQGNELADPEELPTAL